MPNAETINAAAAAGPVVLLALAILVMAGVAAVGIWKFVPFLDSLANKIPAALNENKRELGDVKKEVQQGNQYNSANAKAVADVAEKLGEITINTHQWQENLGSNQLKLVEAQNIQAGHFDRAVDVLSNIYDRMGAQSTQMDILLSNTKVTRETADSTQTTVNKIETVIKEGVSQLTQMTTLLTEIKQQTEQKPDDLQKVVDLLDSARAEIINAIRAINTGNSQPLEAVTSNELATEVQS